MRVLVVGLGSIGRRHLANVRRVLPDANVTVWRHARSPGADEVPTGADHVVHTLEEALSPRPNLAILASPASSHVSTATALAAAGIHMLVEKPLSDTLDGVDDLIAECARQRVTLMVGYHLRFSGSLACIHQAINDGVIGRVVSLRAEVGQYLPDWRPGADYRQGVSARSDLGGGVVLELSHELDYVRWLAGEVRSVRAETGNLGGLDIDVEDVAEIVLRFANGAIGSVHLDMVQRSSTRTCRIIGTEGTLEWDGLHDYARMYLASNGLWQDLYGPSKAGVDGMYLAELARFVQCVVEGADVPVDGAAGRSTLALALAAKRSAESGRTIWLDEVLA